MGWLGPLGHDSLCWGPDHLKRVRKMVPGLPRDTYDLFRGVEMDFEEENNSLSLYKTCDHDFQMESTSGCPASVCDTGNRQGPSRGHKQTVPASRGLGPRHAQI